MPPSEDETPVSPPPTDGDPTISLSGRPKKSPPSAKPKGATPPPLDHRKRCEAMDCLSNRRSATAELITALSGLLPALPSEEGYLTSSHASAEVVESVEWALTALLTEIRMQSVADQRFWASEPGRPNIPSEA